MKAKKEKLKPVRSNRWPLGHSLAGDEVIKLMAKVRVGRAGVQGLQVPQTWAVSWASTGHRRGPLGKERWRRGRHPHLGWRQSFLPVASPLVWVSTGGAGPTWRR